MINFIHKQIMGDIMSLSVILGKKCQIVIPKEIRSAAGIAEGDELIIDAVDDQIVLRQKPKSYSRKLKGLHKGLWKGTEASKYVDKERESW
ncbi:MAG TPA: AbrB/MazE/SpoVT family DNA-binding domain-containing protein [Dissulfurispiraceae bacterium]|nr:AbrB/MazE/SpoVT family DNA-binding domain-containing protein [Dissulfurispiraceae bacterium]